MKKIILFVIVILVITIITSIKKQPETKTPEPNEQPPSYKQEVVAEDLTVPWSIAFTSPTRILFTERLGRIRTIENGTLLSHSLITFSDVSSKSEEGLMGLTLDPNYEQNKYLYTSLAYVKNKSLVVKILRLIDKGNTIDIDKTILDDIPAATNHAGNRLKFGPDGKLYSTTGDATEKNLAQDKNSLAGKILRLNADGSIPTDNPFPNSYIYSMGHRNPQGIAWHPETKELYSTEHGPSGFDGPGGGDEINHVRAGDNFGWPIVSHERHKDELIDPLIVYTPAIAPASLMIYSGKVFSQFKNNFFFGGLRGTGLYRVVTDTNSSVLSTEKLIDNIGRVRDVVEGPDGYIYYSTSNRDGRGSPQQNDDKIYRLVPSH